MSFLNAIKSVLTTEAPKAEVQDNALTRTQTFVKEFSDVADHHKPELSVAAQKLHGIEVIKDRASAKAKQISEDRKAKERLVFALDSVVKQIGVVAEEVLTLEDAILADQEAAAIAKDASKDVLDTLAKLDAATVLKAARAERAKKAAEAKKVV
jgi:hypothetical protein